MRKERERERGERGRREESENENGKEGCTWGTTRCGDKSKEVEKTALRV